jgi:hypothetical protein
VFTAWLDTPTLQRLFSQPGVIEQLAEYGAAVAMAIFAYDAPTAALVQHLSRAGVQVIAWLTPTSAADHSFHAQNYPQLLERYRGFYAWHTEYQLTIETLGIAIAPPAEVQLETLITARAAVRRLWLAGDNVLYPAARAAYAEMVDDIRLDGFEVQVYQWPIIADDRRAGTTLLQRALEVVDLPADLDVLICASDLPLDKLGGDLGGSLIASYGPSADALWVSAIGLGSKALRRDLLLAAQHTDIIYIDSLDVCVQRGLLTAIFALDWQARVRPEPLRRILVAFVRSVLFVILSSARFGFRVLAWSGWLLAALLWWRSRRKPGP